MFNLHLYIKSYYPFIFKNKDNQYITYNNRINDILNELNEKSLTELYDREVFIKDMNIDHIPYKEILYLVSKSKI